MRVRSAALGLLELLMVINRLQYLQGEKPEATSFTDYYLVETLRDTFVVSMATALGIERALDKAGSPDWLEFHDVFGARHRTLAVCVYRISECTRETRAAVRAFCKARKEEEKQGEDPFAELD
jgi:hypothetical protein